MTATKPGGARKGELLVIYIAWGHGCNGCESAAGLRRGLKLKWAGVVGTGRLNGHNRKPPHPFNPSISGNYHFPFLPSENNDSQPFILQLTTAAWR